MANVAVPFRHWPRTTTACSRHFLCFCSHGTAAAASATSSPPSSSSFFDAGGPPFFPSPSPALPRPRNRGLPLRRLFSSSTPFLSRTVGFRRQGLRLPGSSPLEDGSSSSQEEGSDAELDPDSPRKSRNQKKREARRAVRWGMDLAKFSPPHIKRILRAASLEKEVFDALMLVKRLGPDVREGRRRQFNYIGKLLRSAVPGLMDELIQASKDGDSSKLQALSGLEARIVEDEYEEEDTEYEDEFQIYFDTARRWFDGLIEKDSSIADEVYSIHNVEFDRQELRKLVRRVQSIEEHQLDREKEGEDDVALTRAKNSLACFLRALAKRSAAG